MLEDKVRDVFSDMVVLKNPERTEACLHICVTGL